jgi:hypothetical protein
MKRLAIAILLVAACSGKSKPPTTGGAGSGSGSAAIYAKKVVVSWGISPANGTADVFLQTTDETGKQVSHAIGSFAGDCRVIKPADEMKAVIGVSCLQDGRGVELHATISNDEIVVLKMPVQTGSTPDPMSREEVLRFKPPGGSAIEAAPIP